MIRISAFRSIPPMIQGFVRDVTVRWALEECGLEYEMLLVDFSELASPGYVKLHPFSQVPSYEEDGLVLFESAAIVLHIAEKSHHIMPADLNSQALMKTWMFAAMNTIDPVVKSFEQVEYFQPEEEWAKLRRPSLVEVVTNRLNQLADHLKDKDYLIGQFSAADIVMAMSLRNLGDSELFTQNKTLIRYVEKCTSRAAFKTALNKHISLYQE